MKILQPCIIFLTFSLFILPLLVSAECEVLCTKDTTGRNKNGALKLKFVAIASIMVTGAIGVSIPIIGKWVPALEPEKDVFFLIKAFAAGIILATAFIHILPGAFEDLTSPCLKENPWRKFPFAGFVAMVSAIGTLMVDSFASSYYKRSLFNKAQPVDEGDGDEENRVDVHGSHGHAHGSAIVVSNNSSSSDLIRRRVISHVLELGIVVHSVIIGISLGTSESPTTIRTLLAALSFHQFFEGMGLGGCITQAKFKARVVTIMSVFFSLTTPIGIGLGIGISSIYNENSPAALIVEGTLNSASAGILIYMALVDLLATDFMSSKMQNNVKLQFWASMSLLLGSGFMSLVAKWN